MSSVQGPPVTLGAGGPDAFGYRWIDSNSPGGPVFNWTDVQDLGTSVSLSDDDFETVPLPFAFPFYGTTQTDVSISSNGYLKFEGSAGFIPYDGIPVSDGIDEIVMPFGADLYPDSEGTIHYYHDEAQGRFIVQWTNILYFGGGTSRNTFQAILYRDGQVRFQYLNTEPANVETIGIENLDATDGLQVAYNTPYVEDELAVAIAPPFDFVTGVTPTSGTVASGASASVSVTFDAAEMAPRSYLSALDVSTNAPGTSLRSIHAKLTVTAGPPAISAAPDTLRFGTVRVGETRQVNLRVRNDGGPLDVTGVTVPDGFRTDVALPFTLAYGEETTVPVTFAPEAEGDVEGDVIIESTDPDDASLAVPFVGTGAPPPQLRLDRSTIASQTLKAGETATEQVTVTNEGGTPLEVQIGFQESASQQPAVTSEVQAHRDVRRQSGDSKSPPSVPQGDGAENETTGRWQTAKLADLGRDSTETGSEEYDVTVLRGGVVGDTIVFEFEFPNPANENGGSYAGWIGIDLDQNVRSGSSRGILPGEDARVYLYGPEYSTFEVAGPNGNRRYDDFFYEEKRARLAFPLEALGGDRRMSLRALVSRNYTREALIPRDGVAFLGGTLWMTAAPTSFTLAPGESLPIDVTFDPVHVAQGDHEGKIVFHTNDPLSSTVEIETNLTVDGVVVDWMSDVAVRTPGGLEQSITLGQSPVATDERDPVFGEGNDTGGSFSAIFHSMNGERTTVDVRSDSARHVRVWWMDLTADADVMPLTVTWDPTTLPDVPVRLVDAYGGTVVNVDMHETTSVTLTDDRVQMLGIAVGESLQHGFSLRYLSFTNNDVTYDLGGTGISFTRSRYEYSTGLIFAQRIPVDPASSFEGIPEANVSTYRWVFDSVGAGDLRGQFRFNVQDLPDAGIDRVENVLVYSRRLSESSYRKEDVFVDDRGDLDATNDDLVWEPSGDDLFELVFASDTDPLPVELTSLTGTADDDRVTLAWTTASETNNGGFEVQRQSATGRFETLSFVQGAGTTSEASTYRFTDTGIPFEADSLTYRLQQVDLDGTATLTDPVTVVRRAPDAVTLHGTFPNPARDRATLRFELPDDRDVSVQVYDLLGRRVLTLVDAPRKAGRSEMILDTRHLGTGTYFVRLVAGDTVRTQRMVVVR